MKCVSIVLLIWSFMGPNVSLVIIIVTFSCFWSFWRWFIFTLICCWVGRKTASIRILFAKDHFFKSSFPSLLDRNLFLGSTIITGNNKALIFRFHITRRSINQVSETFLAPVPLDGIKSKWKDLMLETDFTWGMSVKSRQLCFGVIAVCSYNLGNLRQVRNPIKCITWHGERWEEWVECESRLAPELG